MATATLATAILSDAMGSLQDPLGEQESVVATLVAYGAQDAALQLPSLPK
jgi:hypothetical protein